MTETDFFLQGLKNQFYLGLYDPVLQTLAKPANCPKPANEQQRIDRFVLLQRCLIAQGHASKTAGDIKPSATLPPDLLAVRGLAVYIVSDELNREAALEELLSLGSAHGFSLPNVAICVASALLNSDRFAAALPFLEKFPRDLECVFLASHVYLKLNRFDRAQQLVAAMKQWAEDATLAHLIEAQTNLVSANGEEQKLLEAFYIFEELEQGRAASALVLGGKALASLQLGKYAEARSILADAHQKFSSDADILANYISVLYLFNEVTEAEAMEKKLFQLQPAALKRRQQKSEEFDLAVQKLL